MILLDTNVVSELMKATPEPAVMTWINAIPGATSAQYTVVGAQSNNIGNYYVRSGICQSLAMLFTYQAQSACNYGGFIF